MSEVTWRHMIEYYMFTQVDSRPVNKISSGLGGKNATTPTWWWSFCTEGCSWTQIRLRWQVFHLCSCCQVPRWFYLFRTLSKCFVSSGVKCSDAVVDCQFGPDDSPSSRRTISNIISNASANTSEKLFPTAEKFFGPNVSSLQSEQGLIMQLSHWQSTVIKS